MTLLALPCPSGVELWLVDLDQPGDPSPWLAPEELARAGRFHFEHDARRYRASHSALRQLLARRTGLAPQALCFDQGTYGKPRLAAAQPPHFNLSHSGGWALIGICASAPIGVDIEAARAMDDLLALAEHNFSPREFEALRGQPQDRQPQAFLRCWTRKEACLKALGSGLSVEPSVFEAGIAPEALSTTIGFGGGTCRMEVISLDLPQGLQGAVARIAEADRHLAL